MEIFLGVVLWIACAAWALWLYTRKESELTLIDAILSLLFAPWVLVVLLAPLVVDAMNTVIWRAKR